MSLRANQSTVKLSDAECENLLLDLIERHLDEESRRTMRKWLAKRSGAYTACVELGLVDEREG